jgi:hypothetical protein
MSMQEHLQDRIDQERQRLRECVPPDREGAILALLREQAKLPHEPDAGPGFDLITGRRLANPGANRALQLCLEAGEIPGAPDLPAGWAKEFLAQCARLAEAELVLSHGETGFMRLIEERPGNYDAWIAAKRVPTGWRERADIDWWAGRLARHVPLEPASGQPDQQADRSLKRLSYQFGYPPDAVIGGCPARTYLDLLRLLIARAIEEADRGETGTPRSEQALIAELARALRSDPAVIARAVAAFTVDDENAAYHAAVPGVAAAPLVRIAPDRLVLSLHGLTTEPLFFLTRELRRRDPQDYHNTAHLRETAFRQDLYALFEDKRFVTSQSRIVLRRDDHNARTDLDAVIFDRKTGTLGVFELKSQDPFARSTAELARQRETVLYANRQVSGSLDWLKRHGANELLNRVDQPTAKKFRAQKVYSFVLGRYLAHFNDGAEPDRRAAWGTWPQLLRLLDTQPIHPNDANPIASLFNRLSKDQPVMAVPGDAEARVIELGELRIRVHASYGAMQG